MNKKKSPYININESEDDNQMDFSDQMSNNEGEYDPQKIIQERLAYLVEMPGTSSEERVSGDNTARSCQQSFDNVYNQTRNPHYFVNDGQHPPTFTKNQLMDQTSRNPNISEKIFLTRTGDSKKNKEYNQNEDENENENEMDEL